MTIAIEAAAQPSAHAAWSDALLAAACIVVDPVGLGGIRVRAAAGPVREAWIDHLRALVPEGAPVRNVPLHVDDGRLFGGLDLAASLRAGRPIVLPGLLAEVEGGFAFLSMAERIDASVAGRIAATMEGGVAGFGTIAFDEGDDDEGLAATLQERLAIAIDLRRCSVRTLVEAIDPVDSMRESLASARSRLKDVVVPDDLLEALCAAAVSLGIGSMRIPLFAIRVARASAAIHGRDVAATDDAANAARLVFTLRARHLPSAAPAEDAIDDAPPDEPSPREGGRSEPEASGDDALQPESPDEAPDLSVDDAAGASQQALDDVVLEAALAAMPAGVLHALARGAGGKRAQPGRGSGAGASQRGGARGAPAGVRRSRPRAPERLSLIETLRAAAPWQRVRRAEATPEDPRGRRIHIRAEDLHVVRFKQRKPTTTVFVVDASGSSALNRLAEAKGAVELLLADCYVRRDSVAVLAFRGKETQLLLPPTRSLVRARRSLASLPGGGGTPLASALDATRELVVALRRKGDTVLVVLLTDGRANVARDGSGGRPQADADAMAAARALRAMGLDALLIDTSPKPHAQAARLAAEMGALYRPLPSAAASEMSAIVNRAARGAGAGPIRRGA